MCSFVCLFVILHHEDGRLLLLLLLVFIGAGNVVLVVQWKRVRKRFLVHRFAKAIIL